MLTIAANQSALTLAFLGNNGMYIIPLIIIFLSISGIAYIVAKRIRALPELGGEGLVYPKFDPKERADDAREKTKTVSSYNILGKILEVKEGDTLFLFMEKFFRRMRVRLMKMENFLMSLADRLHEKGLERRSPVPKDDSENHLNNGKDNASSIAAFNGGNTEFDERYWLDVLKHEPQSIYPYKKLGDIYVARQDFSQARSLLRCALKIDPSDSEVKDKIRLLRGKRTRRV